MMTQELKTKTYGAMVDGYWVCGFEDGAVQISDNFDDLKYTADKEQVVNFIESFREVSPEHEYTLVTITVELEER